jgi:hypothetical protein
MAEDIMGRVISLFSNEKTANMSDKEIVLQQRHKELGENKYARFFRPKTDEADVPLAQFFYSLYKIISPLRVFMKDMTRMAQLRQIVLEAFVDPPIVETLKRLSPQAIEARSKTTPSSELVAEIRADMDSLSGNFNSSRINGVNRCHNMIMLIFQLVNYDYPGILRKFDPNFAEGPFSGTPKFMPVKTELIAKELGDFLTVSMGLMPESDWKTLLKLLKVCAKEELIPESQFAQMVIGLRDILNSKILLLLAQYGSKNPVWVCKPRIPDEHIAEAWVEARTLKAQACIDTIQSEEKRQQIDALVKEIFESDDLVRLENYVPGKGSMFEKGDFADYLYAEGINYLSSFLTDCFDKEIHDLCDLVLIRGQWTSNASSKEMSESLHQLQALPAMIADFDEALSVDGTDGSRLKAALIRADRDPTQARYINGIIETVNEKAQEILEQAEMHFSVISRHIKNLGDDVVKKHPELLVNWRELSSINKDNPLAAQMAKAHKKTHDFVQLMQLCVQ